MRAVALAGLGLWVALAAGCAKNGELEPRVAGPASPAQALAPQGTRVGGAVLGSEGGTFVVTSAGEGYAETVVTVAPGVFSEPTKVEALLLPREDDPKDEMPKLLALVAERPFGEGAVTVTVLRRRPILGVEPKSQRLLGYASGLGAWVPFDETEGLAPLQGDLASVRAAATKAEAAGMMVIGETTDDPAAAVRAGAKAVSAGLASLEFELAAEGSEVVSGDEGRRFADRLRAGAAFVLFKGNLPLSYLWLTPPTIWGADEPAELTELLCHGQERRVLLTHGVISHTDGFEGQRDLIRGLSVKGMRVGRFSYPTGYRITRSGSALATLLAGVRGACEKGAEDLDMVGHSMGGLVIRAAMQDYGAPIRRAVLVSTPNAGGRLTGWIRNLTGDGPGQSSAPVAAIQASSPGLGVDLLEGSEFLESLNGSPGAKRIADRLYVVGGWSSKEAEPKPNDGSVDLSSALALDLPEGHEHYLADGEDKAPRAVEVSGELPATLEGRPADRFGHSDIHEKSSSNGLLDHVTAMLRAP